MEEVRYLSNPAGSLLVEPQVRYLSNHRFATY